MNVVRVHYNDYLNNIEELPNMILSIGWKRETLITSFICQMFHQTEE